MQDFFTQAWAFNDNSLTWAHSSQTELLSVIISGKQC